MIAIIDGCGTNIASIQFALQRLNTEAILTTEPEKILAADYVILPGVGHANYAMQQLQQKNLINVIKKVKKPLLGICLGMQLLFNSTEEGNCKCLGIINAEVKKLPENPLLTLPHMGWNQLQFESDNPLFKAIEVQSYVYFVHNYAVPVNSATIATATHTDTFCAIVNHENFYGMQFHPERSGKIGQQLLKNFLEIN